MTPKKPRKFTPRQEASSAETAPERLKELADDPKLARLVAANSNALAELLLELSRNDDKAVRKACTSNANTPVEALLKLGAQFPEQLLENPVFDLLLLAHPGVFEDLPTATLNSLLKRNQVPVELIRWAWNHRGESTLHSLLMNPNTPADVVEELCKSKDAEVRMAAVLHCSKDSPRWSRCVHTWDDLAALSIVDEQLRVTRFDKDFFLLILAGLIRGINARHFEAWNRWCWHGEDQYSKALVNEPGAPEELLLQVIQKAIANPDDYGRVPHLEDIIRQCRCSQRVLNAALAAAPCSPDLRVLMCAAESPVCPSSILEEISVRDQAFMDELNRYGLQTTLAANPNSPANVLELLSDSEFDDARAYVYLHPNTSESTRLKMVTQDPAVREKAIERERFDLANHDYCWRKVTCWQNRDINTLGSSLASHEGNILCEDLFSHEHERRLEAYWRLRRDRDFYYVPFKLKTATAESIIKKKTSTYESTAIKKWCISAPLCPAAILVKNYRSRAWIDRFIVAQHVKTPEDILKRLVSDGNQLVRRAARNNLDQRSARADQPSAQPSNP